MSNFAMETILGKGFPQVHTEFIARVLKARVLVENTFLRLCPRGEIAFSIIVLAFIINVLFWFTTLHTKKIVGKNHREKIINMSTVEE